MGTGCCGIRSAMLSCNSCAWIGWADYREIQKISQEQLRNTLYKSTTYRMGSNHSCSAWLASSIMKEKCPKIKVPECFHWSVWFGHFLGQGLRLSVSLDLGIRWHSWSLLLSVCSPQILHQSKRISSWFQAEDIRQEKYCLAMESETICLQYLWHFSAELH